MENNEVLTNLNELLESVEEKKESFIASLIASLDDERKEEVQGVWDALCSVPDDIKKLQDNLERINAMEISVFSKGEEQEEIVEGEEALEEPVVDQAVEETVSEEPAVAEVETPEVTEEKVEATPVEEASTPEEVAESVSDEPVVPLPQIEESAPAEKQETNDAGETEYTKESITEDRAVLVNVDQANKSRESRDKQEALFNEVNKGKQGATEAAPAEAPATEKPVDYEKEMEEMQKEMMEEYNKGNLERAEEISKEMTEKGKVFQKAA